MPSKLGMDWQHMRNFQSPEFNRAFLETKVHRKSAKIPQIFHIPNFEIQSSKICTGLPSFAAVIQITCVSGMLVLTNPAFVELRYKSIGIRSCSICSAWNCGMVVTVDHVPWTLAIGDWRFYPNRSILEEFWEGSFKEALLSRILRRHPVMFFCKDNGS